MSRRLLCIAVLACLPAGMASAEIAIATVGPMQGQYAMFGEQLRHGAEMAVADINAAGGINGEKLTLEIGDDGCDPQRAITVATELAAKGVKFVAGHFCSNASIAAAGIYEQNGILEISPAATNPKFTDQGGWNVARVSGRDDGQGVFAGSFLATAYRDKKIAVLDDGSSYGKGMADALRRTLAAAGVKEALSERYAPGGKDFGALVTRLIGAAIDVVYIGGASADAGLIVRRLREAGSPAQIVAGDTLVAGEFWSAAGPAANGTIMTFPADPQRLPAAKDVIGRFAASGYAPEGATLYAYAAVQAYRQAAVAVGGVDDNRKIAQWLRAGNTLNTVLGDLSMDEKGDIRNPKYVWYRWSDGKYAEDVDLNR